ncbi:adenine methyltransferase [Weissella minor]|uniref:DNA N-6-adenine-methyltransferase n=1 Tax=Weissella minor TaxID=1620 RepID=UPI001BAFC408|nr:DNA N-6-adenine-methyltransferase [Weissella minor]MBS0950559.1 adenine methyltransferase [Weissella minor]
MSEFTDPQGAAMTSKRQDWETPQAFFDELNERFNFDIDAAATEENHKLDNFISPEMDSLNTEWQGNVFINPPYGTALKRFVKKAYEEHLRDSTRVIVMLIPARTDTSYWHDYIFGKAKVEFLRGRLKFEIQGKPSYPAPFPSALIIYGGN